MNKPTLKELFLIKLYELSDSVIFEAVETAKIEAELNITDDQSTPIIARLNDRGLAKSSYSNWRFYSYITAKGIEEVEKIMASQYEEQEYQILQKLVENGAYQYTNDDELANALSISKDDLYVFLEDFCSKKWIGMIAGGAIHLYPAGVTAFQKWESVNLSNSRQNSGDIYNNTYHATVIGVQQGGHNNTQNNIQNINPDFIKAINELLALIENSSLNSVQKIHTKADVQIIKDLADLEKSPEVLELANSKIEAVKEVISMTADMTSLGMVLIPILQAAFGS